MLLAKKGVLRNSKLFFNRKSYFSTSLADKKAEILRKFDSQQVK